MPDVRVRQQQPAAPIAEGEAALSSDFSVTAACTRLRDCADLITAAACLKEIGHRIGMPHPAVIDDYSSERLLTVEDGRALTSVLGWDPTFVEQWVDQRLHLISPIAAVCRMSTKPFCWDAQPVAEAVLENGRGSDIHWPLTPENGVFGGITVPVHLPRGRTGSVSWYACKPSIDTTAILAAHGDQLRLAAYLFLDRVYSLRLETGTGQHPAVSLSDRELECLTWAALGRTDNEIATIIHRSPTTARFHVDNAVRKLGARNRTQAVAIAAQQGLIHPLPSPATDPVD